MLFTIRTKPLWGSQQALQGISTLRLMCSTWIMKPKTLNFFSSSLCCSCLTLVSNSETVCCDSAQSPLSILAGQGLRCILCSVSCYQRFSASMERAAGGEYVSLCQLSLFTAQHVYGQAKLKSWLRTEQQRHRHMLWPPSLVIWAVTSCRDIKF